MFKDSADIVGIGVSLPPNSMKSFVPLEEDLYWIERLRAGHYVFLCKEQRFAQIELPWCPPPPGCILGKITFRVIQILHPRVYGLTECWFINPSGKGFDNNQLILPCEGNLPSFPDPIEQHSILELRLEIAKLRTEVDYLKRLIQDCHP